uniref:NADH-ubiquinone oxidoreductase chain 2 n=1 Tax=Melamphaus rubrocinctus TaxID=238647 RepID=A0A4Y1JVU0_9HEMI|nr:NADH dehydrogenase subunit 2 [Melamphaus rubrocinctus]APO08858.1 NADH dehydrogenase subunit 2 [Melamphaus rubrocinctus]
MNFNKIIFILIMVTSTVTTMSANNWLGMWMGMEINLMSFIPLIHMKKNKKTSQGCMIYFLSQSIGSILLLFSILINKFIMYNAVEELSQMIMTVSLMIKLASAPFHMWLPEMMVYLNWTNCFLLMTWQKMAPLTILSFNPNNMVMINIVLSSMLGAIGGLNQTSMRKIMAYSSINHLSWIMMMMMMEKSWYTYMLIYTIIIMLMMMLLMKKNIYFMNQITSYKLTMMEKVTISSLMMSMGGMPPFMGFIPKWMVMQNMINSQLWLIMLVMVLMSLLTLFYYIRMFFPMIMIYNTKIKWSKTQLNTNKMITIIFSTNLMLPLVLTMPMF